jgi:tetratricopeptide (TPR) repeat protein
LYDFLSSDHSKKFSARSSVKSLYERADEIYKDLSRLGKTDPDTTLKMNLAGRAKSVFINDSEKERYDNTLAIEVLTELDQPLEIVGRNKFIETKALASLLQEAKKLGVTETVAMEYIEEYAKKRNWGVQRDVETTIVKLPLCGYCNTLATSAQEKRCRNCGEALVQPCPKCGQPTPTENSACTRCGCHTGDGLLVKALLKDGKRLLVEGEIEQAISYFNHALDYWADWQPALDEKKRAESKKRERTEALDKIKALVKARKLEAGESQLEQFKENYGQALIDTLKKQIDEGLQRAKQAYDSAEKYRLSGKTEEAFDKYEESLSYCVDFTPVLSAMVSRPPPPPPPDITAQWLGESLRLSWSQVKARGSISYRLVRKQDGLPANDRDGKIIAETAMTKADDVKIKPGIAYYYGVFSVRAGAVSPHFASTGPYLKTAEIEKVDYETSNGQVTIQWQLPTGCIAVEVWRRQSIAPSHRGEGKQITASTNYLLDTDLQNGQRYGYLLVAKYPHPEDSTCALYSKGVNLLATPVAPPEPVKDLSASRNERTVFLTWTMPPGKAQVQIRQAQSIPDITPGQIVSLKNVERFGSPIQITASGRAQTTLKTQGRVFFVPLSILSETAVLGNPVTVTTIDEVSNLASQRNSRNIILTWQWPSGASEALVAYHHNYFPKTPGENGATKVRVTRSDHECNHYWELHSATQKKHYFTVFVRDPTADIYSNGESLLETMGQGNIVRYQVVVKKQFFNKTSQVAWVELTSEEGEPLEGLQVVRKSKYPPVSKNDGVIVAEVERIIFIDGRSQIEIPKQYLKEGGYLKVFFKDDSFAKTIRLLPAAKDKLKI